MLGPSAALELNLEHMQAGTVSLPLALRLLAEHLGVLGWGSAGVSWLARAWPRGEGVRRRVINSHSHCVIFFLGTFYLFRKKNLCMYLEEVYFVC